MAKTVDPMQETIAEQRVRMCKAKEEKCPSCLYCHPLGKTRAECRKRAPVVMDAAGHAAWPIVDFGHDAWCNDYQPNCD